MTLLPIAFAIFTTINAIKVAPTNHFNFEYYSQPYQSDASKSYGPPVTSYANYGPASSFILHDTPNSYFG